MSFSTLFFIFVFLPVSLILYYVVPDRFRAIPLVLLSLLFYTWAKPLYLILLVLSLVFNYFGGLEIAGLKAKGSWGAAKAAMIIDVIANLAFLAFFKYLGFLIGNVNELVGLHLSAPNIAVPLGISFYTFSILSYILDVYMDRAPVQKNFLNYAVYATFFPKITSGPIVQYKDMAAQLTAPKPFRREMLASGLKLFFIGLFKKVLISDNLATIYGAISGMTNMSIGTAWLGLLCYGFELYFDFSGYSDMAIGIAEMLGYKIAPNFNYPYRSININDLWRRWHITLGAWFRDYVYFPLGGSRCSTPRVMLNLLIIWLLTGLWHGASWCFILWGLWNCAFSMLERFVIKDKMDKVPRTVRFLLTDLIFFLSLVLFFSPTVPDILHYYGQMFGAGHMGLFDGTFLYYFRSSIILLIVAAIGSGPLVKTMHAQLIYRRGKSALYITVAIFAVLLLFSIASMVSSTYTSFLYFQF